MKESLISDKSTPVLVLQAKRHCGLGIVRSLGRNGVPVHVVDANWLSPAFHSRYVRGRFNWDLESSEEGKSVAFLLEVGRKIGRRTLLIPTTDFGALFVCKHARRLEEWFALQQMPSGLVKSLCSKKEMAFLAERFGVPAPGCVFPETRDALVGRIGCRDFPLMLKGIDGRRLEEQAGKRMFIVNSEQELIERYDSVSKLERTNLMLQEYIPGAPDSIWMFNGYFDRSSECLFGVTGQKIRQYPVHIGAACLAVCRQNETVDRLTRDFMKAIGYQGILDLEYRYDARDGQYKVIDINPRIGSTFRLFVTENRMDVVLAFYLDMTGHAVPRGASREGRRWIVEDQDIVSSFRYWREGALTAAQWVKSLGGIRESAYCALDDPFPILAAAMLDVGAVFEKKGPHLVLESETNADAVETVSGRHTD